MKVLKDISPEQREKVHALQVAIDQHKRALEHIDYTRDKEDYLGYMHQFWNFISSYKDEETFAYFERSEYYQKNRNFFTSIDYSRIIETVEALNIMEKPTCENQTFLDNFDHKLTQEIALVNWQGKKKLVMVGAGPLPKTMLHFHDHTDIEQIIGLDSNQESVYIAGQMIRRAHKNTSRIQLVHYNGLNYDYKDADLVFVANFVTPKAKVLNRIAATAKNGVQVLVRTPVSFGKMIYESATEGLDPRLAITQEGEVNNYFLSKTLVLQKFDM